VDADDVPVTAVTAADLLLEPRPACVCISPGRVLINTCIRLSPGVEIAIVGRTLDLSAVSTIRNVQKSTVD